MRACDSHKQLAALSSSLRSGKVYVLFQNTSLVSPAISCTSLIPGLKKRRKKNLYRARKFLETPFVLLLVAHPFKPTAQSWTYPFGSMQTRYTTYNTYYSVLMAMKICFTR